MNQQEFENTLKQGQYGEVLTKHQLGDYYMGEHSHPFDARALIIAGEITLTVAGRVQSYPTGSIFELAKGTVHEERAGPEGVTYLVGRRT